MRRTIWCCVVGVIASGLAMAGPTVEAAAGLSPASQDARPGDTITMAGNFCAAGRTITSITVSTKDQFPKGPIMTFPVDPAAAGVTQTGAGFTFTYPATTARTYVWFTAVCSDGTTASSDGARVTVWPPLGTLWFLSPYDTLFGEPGATTTVDVASMDCVEGSTATLDLLKGSALVVGATSPVAQRAMAFDVVIPAGTPYGSYVARVSCAGINGTTIRDSHQFTIGTSGPGGFPTTGGRVDLLGLAAALVILGWTLVCAGSRRRELSSRT